MASLTIFSMNNSLHFFFDRRIKVSLQRCWVAYFTLMDRDIVQTLWLRDDEPAKNLFPFLGDMAGCLISPLLYSFLLISPELGIHYLAPVVLASYMFDFNINHILFSPDSSWFYVPSTRINCPRNSSFIEMESSVTSPTLTVNIWLVDPHKELVFVFRIAVFNVQPTSVLFWYRSW